MAAKIAKFEENPKVCKRHADAFANVLMCEGYLGLGLGIDIALPKPYYYNGTSASADRSFVPIEKYMFWGFGFSLL